jgi:hypothetical protein
MEHWSTATRVQYGARLAFGLGCLAGALELVVLAASSRLPLGTGALLLTGLGASLLVGLIASGLALVLAPVHTLRADQPAYRNIAMQLGGVAALLAAIYLAPMAMELLATGRTVPALAFAAMPIGVWGVVALNARFWLARVELGRSVGVGWMPVAIGGALVLIVGISLAYPQRQTGGQHALSGDPSLVLVTVDGLRHDALDRVQAPNLQALGAGGVVFVDAVSPTTSSLAAHATLLTGLHPLRHRAAGDHLPLTTAATTVAEVFEREGFATGAFVSSMGVGAHSGLDQGFLTFDDRSGPLPAGLGRLKVVQLAASALGWPELLGLRRSSTETTDAFADWIGAHGALPFFGWLHLEAPLVPGRSSADAVAEVDAAVGRVLEALKAAGADQRTMVLVVGAFGALPPPAGPSGAPYGLTDALVRVPLWMRAPGKPVVVPQVTAQVRLMDVPQTLLAYAGIDGFESSEGVELLGYAAGTRSASMWCPLLGRSADGWLLGMRNNGVKYVHDLAIDDESLYDLTKDPEELSNVALEVPSTVQQARSLLAPDRAALKGLEGLPEVGPSVAARLRALRRR